MISFKKTIVFRLWLICIITLVLPLCGNIIFFGIQDYKKACNKVSQILLENAYIKAQLISNLLNLNKNFIQLLIPCFDFEKLTINDNKKELILKLRKIFSDQFYEISIIYTNKNGDKITFSTQKEANFSFINSSTNFFQKIAISTQPTIALSIETYENIDLKDLGSLFVYTFYKPTTVLSLILQSHKDRITINTALLESKNKIISINKDNSIAYKENISNLNTLNLRTFIEKANTLHNNLSKFSNIEAISFQDNQKTNWGYKISIPNTDICLLSYSNKIQILQTFKNKTLIYSIYIVIIIFGSFLSLFISKRFCSPIQQLDLVMTKLQNGETNIRYKPNIYGFEINKLGSIFNHMIDKLLKQQHFIKNEIIKKEVVSKELFLEEQAQDILLSTNTPYYPNIKISKIYIPATIVSGDFYDIFIKKEFQKNNDIFLIVADASGKGVNGCCYSLILKNLLSTYLKIYSSMEDAIFHTNQAFLKDTKESGMFVTAAIIKYNINTNFILYYSCGHPSICLIKKNQQPQFIYHPGIAFGFKEIDKKIKPMKISISQNDVILMYSDGVTEAHNKDYVLFGEDRLKKALTAVHHLSTFDISHFIIHKISQFVENQEQYDDITVLIIKVEK